MMELLKVVLLGVVQGITEFLPVSSSGHLVILDHFLKTETDSILLNIFMHFGTLIAIVAVYWRDIIRVLKEEWITIGYIAVATVPAVVLALSAGDRLEAYFENMDYVGYFLLGTGILLIAGRYADRKRTVKRPMSWLKAIGIGCAQALALLPGISRSGSTISAGSAFGMDRDRAARFAFLMAIPVMCGAVAKKVLDLLKSGQSEQFDATLFAGLIVSAGVGYLALRLLLRIIHRGNFAWFSGYCFVIGVGVIIYNALT